MIKFDLKFVEWKLCSKKQTPIAIFAYRDYRKECSYEEVLYNAEQCKSFTPFECEELENALDAYASQYVGQLPPKANDNKSRSYGSVAFELEDMGPTKPFKARRLMPMNEPDDLNWGLKNQKILSPDAYIRAKAMSA